VLTVTDARALGGFFDPPAASSAKNYDTQEASHARVRDGPSQVSYGTPRGANASPRLGEMGNDEQSPSDGHMIRLDTAFILKARASIALGSRHPKASQQGTNETQAE
jgi:hypothetical protein